MEWCDDAIVLNNVSLSDTRTLLDVYTRHHGRYKGTLYKNKTASKGGGCQIGDHVTVHWRARLHEHLGTFKAETLHSPAALCLFSPQALYGLRALCALTTTCVSERDPCSEIHEALQNSISGVHQTDSAIHMIRFELTLLRILGYGLDLKRCARTGRTEDLCYVSPRTGRAVSRQGAGHYAPRLLPLPSFFHTLLEEDLPLPDSISSSDLQNGFQLMEFFFLRHLRHHPKWELPHVRTLFISESLRLWKR